MTTTYPATTPDDLWLVISDSIDSLTVPRAPDGLLPPALVHGETRAVLLWHVEDRIEMLIPTEPATTSRVTTEVVRTAARAAQRIAAPTVELRLRRLWRNPATSGHLCAVIALTASVVVVDEHALDLRSPWGFTQWARFRSTMRMANWELPHWHRDFGVSGTVPLQRVPRERPALR